MAKDRVQAIAASPYTFYHSRYWAELLTIDRPSDEIGTISRSIAASRVDLNPHQVDAALFAIRSPLSKGVILADEVGLGKTIEAGLVISQHWAERKRRILLIVPASLRKQWLAELESKFFIPTVILESRGLRAAAKSGVTRPFERENCVVTCSYQFAAAQQEAIAAVPWDLVVIDEAHRLRNIYKTSSILARRVKEATGHAAKLLLLTATPLQNSLTELYGLVSVIDDHVFGDLASFKMQFTQAVDEEARNAELRARLSRICIRTLRKQVVEYIPFTRRMAVTQDFVPSQDEQALYEMVSEYLQRDHLFALPSSQRALITVVLRKLLASSTFAIAGTLRRLVARLEGAPEEGALDPVDFDTLEELEEEWAEDDAGAGEGTPVVVDPLALQQEITDLRRFAALAESIALNAKGEALIPALAAALDRAEALGAARKALIFTESRRTQEYLVRLLEADGHAGQIVTLSGTNSDPESTRIYHAWRARHEGEDTVTGSRPVDIKTAIMEEFRDRAMIMIGTEAAAEGVNLQFCSLVVNYDLPWNPQRIEQRIGRCHRYGQKHDVVVLNFINRANAADKRVYELLSQKLRLFDGVFGASDEVLGALESGIDFEKRIAEIYQSCRTADAIERAFDQLQSELEEQIQAQMKSTRSSLLENFDEEVARKLRVSRDEAQASLDDRQRWLLLLTRQELGERAEFASDEPRFRYKGDGARPGEYHLDWQRAEQLGAAFYRQEHPLAQSVIERAMQKPLPPARLTFDYAAHGAKVAVLEPLLSLSGWLELVKVRVKAFDETEYLVLTGVTERGTELDQEICERLLSLPARASGEAGERPPAMDALSAARVGSVVQLAEQKNARFFDEEVLKLDRWAEDLKQSLEREIKELDKEIRETRQSSRLAARLEDKLAAQRKVRDLEEKRKRMRRDLYEQQDQIDGRRDQLIAGMERQLKQEHVVGVVFSVRWNLSEGEE
jgi:superfamily II DNA or RNA helicase